MIIYLNKSYSDDFPFKSKEKSLKTQRKLGQ